VIDGLCQGDSIERVKRELKARLIKKRLNYSDRSELRAQKDFAEIRT
jgi:hypothetical protein